MSRIVNMGVCNALSKFGRSNSKLQARYIIWNSLFYKQNLSLVTVHICVVLI